MDINEAIKQHPNLMVNFRRAALALTLAHDMALRGDYTWRRDRYLRVAGQYVGMAQGWLNRRYSGLTLDAWPIVRELSSNMVKYGGRISDAGFERNA